MQTTLNAPVLLVGTGRCGSTILYSLLSMHRDLAWIPSWVARYPDRPWLAAANRLWSVPGLDGFRETKGFPKPVEPYGLYEGRFPGYFHERADAAAIAEAEEIGRAHV